MTACTRVALTAALALICGCPAESTPSSAASPTADSTATGSAVVPAVGLVLPPRRNFNPNPLNLPARALTLKKDQLVFAVPKRILAQAKLGSTLILRAATVLTMDGAEVIVRVGDGPSYNIHPGYLIVPKAGRMRRNARVIVNYRGKLRHGIVRNDLRKRVSIRYTDLGVKRPNRTIAVRNVGLLPAGLQPGSFAVYRAEHEHKHVLLVSSAKHPDEVRRWLVLGHNGQARIMEEEQLRAMPARYAPKVGTELLVTWRGSMVPATLRRVDKPGLFTVRRARAGAPFIVGPGQIMPRARPGPAKP